MNCWSARTCRSACGPTSVPSQGHRFDVSAGNICREQSAHVDCRPLALLTSVEQRSKMLVVSHQFFGQRSHLFRGQVLYRQLAWKRRLVSSYIDHEKHLVPPPRTDFLSVYPKSLVVILGE